MKPTNKSFYFSFFLIKILMKLIFSNLIRITFMFTLLNGLAIVYQYFHFNFKRSVIVILIYDL